jgi:hypothetical protein
MLADWLTPTGEVKRSKFDYRALMPLSIEESLRNHYCGEAGTDVVLNWFEELKRWVPGK